MAIKTNTVYTVACDICKADYDHDGYSFNSTEQALEDARDGDWWATEDLVICWGDEYDDEHFDRAREHAATLTGDALEEFLEWCPEHWRDQITPETPRFDAHMPGQTTIPLVPVGAEA